ncbi:MAG TPA: DUF2336 domain-containing protein [Microvirga sp.]|jgi:uncharacterized protein (DUF2336 family)
MSFSSFVNEVEDAIASKDPARRIETLRRITDLFVAQEAHFTEGHVELFDEVILRLARDLEQRARRELSERLADLDKAPRKVIRSLAFDLNGAIAQPVLERSHRLDEDDLVMIARARGQEHLLAMSKRVSLSERVTDVLVHRGDGQVVRSVASNEGARFSDRSFNELVDKARADEDLQAVLRLRRDIPAKTMARLLEAAQSKARQTLTQEHGPGAAGDVSRALDGAAAAQRRDTAALDKGLAEAVAAVESRAKAGTIAEDVVIDWVRRGRIDEALAALAHLARIPVEIVANAYRSPHHDPLLFILRSVRFSWGSLKAFLTAKLGGGATPDILRGAFEAFQQLSVPTAQRVVRFTVARERTSQDDAA